MTELLFNENSYLENCEATITSLENNIIQLDRTIFYAESGGQPGDLGVITLDDRVLKVIDTQKGNNPKEIHHIIEGEIDQDLIGKSCELSIDWERRKLDWEEEKLAEQIRAWANLASDTFQFLSSHPVPNQLSIMSTQE